MPQLRRRVRRPGAAALALTAGALALLGPGAPAAVADPGGSTTVTGGAVQATLTWGAGELGVRQPKLTIARGGVVAVDAVPVFADTCSDADCRLLPSGDRKSPLQIVDLDADGDPEVVVDGFTLGAHCCAVSEVFGWSGPVRNRYERRAVQWGNGGYDLRDLDGDRRAELVSADDRFSARYTAYALSARPVRILRYSGPGAALSAVTRRFPAAVRADLREQRRLLTRARRQKLDRRGVVAALVADLYTLREAPSARAQLDRSRRSGDLGSTASARSFRRALLRDLARWGYR